MNGTRKCTMWPSMLYHISGYLHYCAYLVWTCGNSFSLGSKWIKGIRTLARDGGKRTLPQIQIPIWLTLPSHIQSQQIYIIEHADKLIGTIGAAKKVLTSKNNWVLNIGRCGLTYLFLQLIWLMSGWHTNASLGRRIPKLISTIILIKIL